MTTKRDFLVGSAAAVAAAAFGARSAAAAGKVPVLGLIFPPLNRGVPEEGVAMYGDKLKFVVTGLGVERMTPDGFEAVLPKIPAAAEKLAAAGAEAIELTGTSLTRPKPIEPSRPASQTYSPSSLPVSLFCVESCAQTGVAPHVSMSTRTSPVHLTTDFNIALTS